MTDLDRIRCFACGQYGHMKRNCPSKPGTSRRDRASSPVSEEHKAACYTARMPPDRPLEEIADYARCAAAARQALADATGKPTVTEPYIVTPFRQQYGYPPRTETELREIARQPGGHRRYRREQVEAMMRELEQPAGSR